MKFYAVLTAVLVDQTLALIMSRIPDAKRELPIFLLLDECYSLSLPQSSISVAIANCRKHFCGLLLCYQSPFQLVSQYSQAGAKSLEENAYAVVHMPPIDIDIAAKLEQSMGKYEFLDSKDVRHVRPLMTASEIRETAKESFLIFGSHRIVKMRLKPFYEIAKYRKYSEMTPYEPEDRLPFTTVPLITIDEAKK